MDDYISREGLKQAMLKRGFFPAIVAGALYAQPAEKVVAVDGELGLILNFAVRYACGRMTYAPMTVINFITPLIPHLDDRTLALLDKQAEGIAVSQAVAEGACDKCGFLKRCITDDNFTFPVFAWCSRRKAEILANWEKEGK